MQGALTPYSEHATGHSRIFYLESEVDALAKKWKPQKRRHRKREATRQSIAAKVLPLIKEGRSFEEICFETLVHPDAVSEIIESFKLGPNCAALKRFKSAQEKLAYEKDLADLQTRRAEDYHAIKRQTMRKQHELDRRLAKAGERKTG